MLEGRDWHPFLITTGGTGSSRQPFTWDTGTGTAWFGASFALCPGLLCAQLCLVSSSALCPALCPALFYAQH